MNRILKEEMEQDFFYVHDSIVYGAIKKCGIHYDHANYDDFVQIGRIKLVDAYKEFPKSLFNEEYFYQFTGYAYRKVYWALMDQIRKEQRIFEREAALPDSFEEWQMTDPEPFDEDFVMWELFHSMLQCLSEKEQVYLKDSVIEQLTITEIAKKRKVSRKTVYAWRKQVAKKLEHYQAVIKK
ncbi:RNA polymerase sigma factor, sigma-70 family [Marinilactibacillus piezotolerans]|uniref:RNA polymerase sigma factor, sigma-70 family n=1 Tax=Marinilactibacillus piezotolerans TaxID=258723 RepID=A0A1I3WXV3_9LACT|nr:sigma-70 family RNA polymerase sigma factor [Marinilactibacillus piezotolerans]SFK11231.1 RNA polymerase sigma factor, sigma-70 family [Marinilactibacillus piezotolerans]